jgi:hypothetical protein
MVADHARRCAHSMGHAGVLLHCPPPSTVGESPRMPTPPFWQCPYVQYRGR